MIRRHFAYASQRGFGVLVYLSHLRKLTRSSYGLIWDTGVFE